ncbi:hypothetical protein [Kordiimonas marina]|uniref:F0F1 ATP synthase subunit B family protein n=1 Tax=Kordiimonas marina TaxID=2872312 RepID=UPI001FF33A3F|nr:hypothetical protein [Kordiimonas marina]MCJ9429396.1 hypothetical protein [Kordiimonas marina]
MEAHEAFYVNPEFWVALGFFGFVALVLRMKGHKQLGAMLDERSAAIKAQIEEAKTLRDEAEGLLLDYQRKQRETEKEAAELLAHAQEDARIMTEEAKADIAVLIERRTRAAQEKIHQAEAAAVKEVKAAAVNVAVAAASQVMADSLKGKAGGTLITDAIDDLDGKLH